MVESTVEQNQQNDPKAPATREESRYLVPPVDIYETEEGLVVVADLPGVKKENTDIRVENNILTIQGKTEKAKSEANPVYNEFELHNYYRQFELNEEVDQEKISAELKHGVLTLHLPKREETKPKKISVKVD
jgi:HSP20 family protein